MVPLAHGFNHANFEGNQVSYGLKEKA